MFRFDENHIANENFLSRNFSRFSCPNFLFLLAFFNDLTHQHIHSSVIVEETDFQFSHVFNVKVFIDFLPILYSLNVFIFKYENLLYNFGGRHSIPNYSCRIFERQIIEV